MIAVKLNSNGYTKVYEDKNVSIVGDYNNDIEVLEWIDAGGVVADEFTTKELVTNAISNYKRLYLAIINKKLADLDYDSLATVKLWEDDANYGVEATKILNWYKAIIAKNYELFDAGTMLSDDDYIAQINAITF